MLALGSRYGANLKCVYVVHATYWLRFQFWCITPFVATSFWSKMQYVESLRLELPPDSAVTQQLRLPDFIWEYERYWYGPGDSA